MRLEDVPQAEVEKHLGLVGMVARKCRPYLRNGRLDPGDLWSWGTLGLYFALAKFDPKKGFKFSSYAAHCIHGYILNGMRTLERERSRARERGDSYINFDLDSCEDGELEARLGLATEDRTESRINTQQLLDELWKRLTPRQEKAMRLLLYEGMNQEEAAQALGVSRSLVSRMWKETIAVGKELFEYREAA